MSNIDDKVCAILCLTVIAVTEILVAQFEQGVSTHASEIVCGLCGFVTVTSYVGSGYG